jgi:RNAse (barnase) inhibitor barstar
MQQITLSGEHWTTPYDFYHDLLRSLGAPNWHGHNLDALWDSITGGDINQVNPPFRVTISGIDVMSPNCKILVGRFAAMVSDARAKGYVIEIGCL